MEQNNVPVKKKTKNYKIRKEGKLLGLEKN